MPATVTRSCGGPHQAVLASWSCQRTPWWERTARGGRGGWEVFSERVVSGITSMNWLRQWTIQVGEVLVLPHPLTASIRARLACAPQKWEFTSYRSNNKRSGL